MTPRSRTGRPRDDAALREQVRAIFDALTDVRADVLRQGTELSLESKENSAVLTSSPDRIKDEAKDYFEAFDVEDLPATIQIVNGDGQYAETGHEVGPIDVKVLNGNGGAVRGAIVLFTTPAGSGSIRNSSAKTNNEGVATARDWRLGRRGTNQLIATVTGIGRATASTTITATATTYTTAAGVEKA